MAGRVGHTGVAWRDGWFVGMPRSAHNTLMYLDLCESVTDLHRPSQALHILQSKLWHAAAAAATATAHISHYHNTLSTLILDLASNLFLDRLQQHSLVQY